MEHFLRVHLWNEREEKDKTAAAAAWEIVRTSLLGGKEKRYCVGGEREKWERKSDGTWLFYGKGVKAGRIFFFFISNSRFFMYIFGQHFLPYHPARNITHSNIRH